MAKYWKIKQPGPLQPRFYPVTNGNKEDGEDFEAFESSEPVLINPITGDHGLASEFETDVNLPEARFCHASFKWVMKEPPPTVAMGNIRYF